MNAKQYKLTQSMSSNKDGCFGCLTILGIILSFPMGYQIFFYQNNGRLDLSLPKIQFGTPKSVQSCAEYLKNSEFAKNVNIDSNNAISFSIDSKFTDDHGPSTSDVDWGQKGNLVWNWVDSYVSSSIKSRCQKPVTVNYGYTYVKRRFTGGVSLR